MKTRRQKIGSNAAKQLVDNPRLKREPTSKAQLLKKITHSRWHLPLLSPEEASSPAKKCGPMNPSPAAAEHLVLLHPLCCSFLRVSQREQFMTHLYFFHFVTHFEKSSHFSVLPQHS